MRTTILIALLAQLTAGAQPGWPSFCFTLADNDVPQRPLGRTVEVVQHYRERIPYFGMNDSWLKPDTAITLISGPLFRAKDERWQFYGPLEGVAESHLLVIAGSDTMRIDLPEDMTALIQRALKRWDRETPEVFRFQKGRFDVLALIADPAADRVANALAKQLIAEDEAAYKQGLLDQEEYYRNLPPVLPTEAQAQVHVVTTEEVLQEIAARPAIEVLEIEQQRADTLWLRITGGVMLDGGCASGMPQFGIEMLTDTAWLERHAMDRSQMDCGLPWMEWKDRTVMLPPLRWWVSVNSPPARKELVPGTYRLVLMGASGELKRTSAFVLE